MSDPNAIQAKIDETLAMETNCEKYLAHAREMLPRYARALKEAVRQHRDELRCSDPTCACRGSCGKLDIQMNSILKLLDGKSEGSDGTI